MNRILKDVFYMLLMISSILIGCQSSQDKTKLIEKVVEVEKEKLIYDLVHFSIEKESKPDNANQAE